MLPSNEKFKNKMQGYNMYLINFLFSNCPKITINISNNDPKWFKFELGDHLVLCNAIKKTQKNWIRTAWPPSTLQLIEANCLD